LKYCHQVSEAKHGNDSTLNSKRQCLHSIFQIFQSADQEIQNNLLFLKKWPQIVFRSSSTVHDMVPCSRELYSKWTRHDLNISFSQVMVKCSRGRNAGSPTPPAQIPSMRHYRTGLLPQVRRRNVVLLLVPCSARSALLPAPVCRSRPSEQSSPRPEAFSPRAPPVLGHAIGVIVHLCSFASSILCLRPTSQARTYRAFGPWPSPTGPAVDNSRSPLGSPGFRTKSLRTCSGSLTPQVRCAARVSATYRIAFPTKSQGRQPEIGDFGAQ